MLITIKFMRVLESKISKIHHLKFSNRGARARCAGAGSAFVIHKLFSFQHYERHLIQWNSIIRTQVLIIRLRSFLQERNKAKSNVGFNNVKWKIRTVLVNSLLGKHFQVFSKLLTLAPCCFSNASHHLSTQSHLLLFSQFIADFQCGVI